MEQIFLSPVKNTKNNQRIRENRFYGVRVLVIYNLAYAVLENTLKKKLGPDNGNAIAYGMNRHCDM